jgi:putative copper export protein
MTLLVFGHLLGASIWVGGLVFLGVAAGVARRTIPDAERVEFFRLIGRRFLIVSGAAALLLAGTGIGLVNDRFGGFDQLGDTYKGGDVIAKTVIFAGVVVLALVHSFVLGPRLRRLREGALSGRADEAALRRAAVAGGLTQLAMLAGTVVVLYLAADLVT